MKTSAAATVKRRSMLPAPKTFGAGTSVGASKSSEVLARKSKEMTGAFTSDVHPTSLKVDNVGTTIGDKSNESKGKLAGSLVSIVPSERHTESKQTQLRKPSNLQQPAVTHKRPSSASSVLNRAGRELNQSSSLGKTSRDSGNSTKPTAVKGAAASANDVDDQSAEKKHNRLFRGATSVSASHSARTGTKQKSLPRSVDTAARKLKVPTNYVADGATQMQSSLPEMLSKIDSSYSRSETVLSAEPIMPARLTTETEAQEDAAAFVLPECSSRNSVECRSDAVVGHECDRSESSSGTVSVAGVPDVLSQVANDDSGQLESSSGSLGILSDADLLDTSLLSFDCSSAASTGRMNEVASRCNRTENPADENTLLAVELCSKQSPSTSEIDPPVGSATSESSMPSLRPLSLKSNSSADVGIVADCVGLASQSPRCQQERPSSYMSTSSDDTGNYRFYCIYSYL